MVPQRIFWFGIEGKIRRGLLKVPKNIEYFQNGIYILKKEDMGGYRYISVYPEESWNTSTTISSQQPNLERLVKDDSIGDVLKLPEDSLLYLNLNNHSKVQVAGMYDSFQIWNMEDFEKYLTPDRKAKAEILVKKILVV